MAKVFKKPEASGQCVFKSQQQMANVLYEALIIKAKFSKQLALNGIRVNLSHNSY